MNILDAILPVYDERAGLTRRTTERRVEHRSILCRIDVHAIKHSRAPLLEANGLG